MRPTSRIAIWRKAGLAGRGVPSMPGSRRLPVAIADQNDQPRTARTSPAPAGPSSVEKSSPSEWMRITALIEPLTSTTNRASPASLLKRCEGGSGLDRRARAPEQRGQHRQAAHPAGDRRQVGPVAETSRSRAASRCRRGPRPPGRTARRAAQPGAQQAGLPPPLAGQP